MSITKKQRKKQKRENMAKIEAIKIFIESLMESSLAVITTIRLGEALNDGIKIDPNFNRMLIHNMQNEFRANDELKEVLSQIISTEGYGHGLQFDGKAIHNFTEFMMEYISYDRYTNMWTEYQAERKVSFEKLLEETKKKVEEQEGEEVAHIVA